MSHLRLQPRTRQRFRRRRWIPTAPASGSSVTGTSATTLGSFVSAAAGSSVTGTSARTLGSFTSAATGTFGTTTYVVNDTFPGSSIDTGQWTVMDRLGDQVNSEVNAVIPANVRVSGGSLLIDSKFETVTAGDTTTGAPNPRSVNYTSGQVQQKATPFLYGDVQVRAKLPGGTGLWPCIWLLGYLWQPTYPFTANTPDADWPNGGWWEADIAEFMSNHRTLVNNALHFITANRAGSGEKSLPFDATTRFMVYRIVWAPTSMTWYVDAEDGNGWVQTLSITGTAGTDIPNTPAFLIIHTAIGGIGGGTPDSATFPQTFEVDYARVALTSDSAPVGAAANTLGPFTSAASGSSVTGTSARTLGSFASSATGAHGVTGTAANTLGSFTSSASGSSVTGTSATTLGSFVSAASGTANPPGVAGSIAVTLGSFTSTAAGAHGVTGTSSTTLGPFTSTASGSSVTGTVGATLGSFTSTASGTAAPPGTSGTIAVTLASFTSTASGSSVTGTAVNTLGSFTSTATGVHGVAGTITTTLGAFVCVATGTANIVPGAFIPGRYFTWHEPAATRTNEPAAYTGSDR